MLLMVPDGIFQNDPSHRRSLKTSHKAPAVLVGNSSGPRQTWPCAGFLERHQTPFTSSRVASDRNKCRTLWLFAAFLHGLRKFLHGKTSWKPVLMVASRMISRWFLVEIAINPTNPHGIRWVSPLFHQQLGQLFINDFTKARNGLGSWGNCFGGLFLLIQYECPCTIIYISKYHSYNVRIYICIYDMIWYDMIWYDMIWYDMIYDMIYHI